jgi:regulator of sigma E protease
MSIIIFIIILAILILVHEYGHFITAKKSGIRVDEFGLGFPPKLFSKKYNGTEYTLNAIPFGGFVKIFGEDAHTQNNLSDTEKKQSFAFKPWYTQALVLVGGVVFNVLFACLLIIIGFSIGMPVTEGTSRFGKLDNPKLIITAVLPNSPASKAGLQAGDEILFVDAQRKVVQMKNDIPLTPAQVTETVATTPQSVTILFKRGDGAPQSTTVTPSESLISGKKVIGIAMDRVGILKLPLHQAVIQGVLTTYELLSATAKGLFEFLYKVVTFTSDFSSVSGPVGIASTVKEASALGFVYVLSLTALISLNLAVINLVPFPALDGGRLLFVFIEAITRKKIPPAVTTWVNMIGFGLLLLLMVAVTVHDITRLF